MIWLFFFFFNLLKHVQDFAKKFIQLLHTSQRNPKELFGQPNTSEFYDLIFDLYIMTWRGFPHGSEGRVCLQCGRAEFDPWVGKIPWRRKWQPTAVLLPGKSHEWRSLAAYRAIVHRVTESQTQLSYFIFTFIMT